MFVECRCQIISFPASSCTDWLKMEPLHQLLAQWFDTIQSWTRLTAYNLNNELWQLSTILKIDSGPIYGYLQHLTLSVPSLFKEIPKLNGAANVL